MDIEPQKMSIKQLQAAQDGSWVDVDDDVNNVARDLKAIDPKIRLRWSESAEHFVIYYRERDRDTLITTTKELDQRVVTLVKKIGSDDYDYAAELEKADADAKAASKRLSDEILSEKAQELAFALRKDRGFANSTIYVPEGF